MNQITTVSSLAPNDTVKQSNKFSKEHRSTVIDAAIIRIMKRCKHIDFETLSNKLTLETDTILGFLPDKAFIRQRLDSLISREYINHIKHRRESSRSPSTSCSELDSYVYNS